MRLPIFWRLIIGYMIIFILGMSVGLYSLIQLKKFNTGTQYISTVYALMEYDKKIEDLIISEHRFLKKFLITKDQILYNQFLAAKENFRQVLNEALALSPDPPMQATVKNLQVNQERYLTLVEKEYQIILKKKKYSTKGFNQEREKLVDLILKDLDLLEIQGQQEIRQRIKEQGEAGDSARRIAVILSLIALGSVLIISTLITRSISNPLSLLRLKTREISEGLFKSDLEVSSSPEISELAQAFNVMSHKLGSLDQMKSDFFSTMSHELRTPLTSIKEGIALLEEKAAGPITEKQKKLLSIIAQESHRLIDMVNSSLDLSKMEAGMMDYHLEKAYLSPLIEKVIHEMGPLVETKRIKLETEIQSTLPLVTMDQARILQALRNLIGNALKATPEGGRVGISAIPVEQGIQVAIKDTGPGISEENFSTIFNKFQQVSPPGSYAIKGTGLGLAIVKHIITSHGGKVWVESIIGQGSTFFFLLPA
jgi:two-component system sensor histidine kinase GlrK